MDKIRCPACRGTKKVPKLGGMIGECNTCKGEGKILAVDKPIAVKPEVIPVVSEIVKEVADCLPASDIVHFDTPVRGSKEVTIDSVVSESPLIITTKPIETDIKIDGKKALYKRKTASK